MSNGAEYHVPHALEELLEILAHIRRLGEFPGLKLLCDCGIVWINPDQVVSVCHAATMATASAGGRANSRARARKAENPVSGRILIYR